MANPKQNHRNKPRFIFIIGMMAAGKSTLARLLSKALSYPLIDLDQTIEQQQGCCITELFQRQGEAFFRQLETQQLRAITQQEKAVCATGGGVVENIENCHFMRQHGIVIYLKATVDCLVARLANDQSRPLLAGGKNPRQRLTQLYQKRRSRYEHCAHFCYDSSQQSAVSISQQIIIDSHATP